MNYFSSEDMDCVCYIEEKTNNVVIKFFGMPNNESAELFTIFVMDRLGFDYNPINYTMQSKSVHQNLWKSKYPIPQDDTNPTYINKSQDTDGMYQFAIEDLAKQYV